MARCFAPVFASSFENVGCPVLAFFARAGTMLREGKKSYGAGLIVPALRKVREGRGTHSVYCVSG